MLLLHVRMLLLMLIDIFLHVLLYKYRYIYSRICAKWSAPNGLGDSAPTLRLTPETLPISVPASGVQNKIKNIMYAVVVVAAVDDVHLDFFSPASIMTSASAPIDVHMIIW